MLEATMNEDRTIRLRGVFEPDVYLPSVLRNWGDWLTPGPEVPEGTRVVVKGDNLPERLPAYKDTYGSSRPRSSAGGLVASTAVKGSRISYVCLAPLGTVQESPAESGIVAPSRRSSARPEITNPTVS